MTTVTVLELGVPSPVLLVTTPPAAGFGEEEVEAGPSHDQISSYPLTVSRVQGEPQGNGTALAPGDSLHSVWVFRA